MKKALVSIALIAAAMGAQAEIKIGGNNNQKATVQGAVANTAAGVGSRAVQNIASNKGDVKIGGNNNQQVTVQGAVANTAAGVGARATQNLASNDSTK